MKVIAGLLMMLWPLVAVGDETVTTTDGRRFLLRDDRTWRQLPSQDTGTGSGGASPPTAPGRHCANPESFVELDYGHRDKRSELSELMNLKRPVCMVVDLWLEQQRGTMAQFYYPGPARRDSRSDGRVQLDGLSRDERAWMADNCRAKNCRVAIRGTVALMYGPDQIEVKAAGLAP